jgi:hypothetical protein
MSFLSELKRRNIHRVAAAYAVVAWLVVQGTSVFAPALNLPEWPMRLLALLGLIGFPVALTVAWLYELTPQGLKLAADVPLEPSTRRVTAQKLNYLIIGALVVTVIFLGIDNYRSRAGTATPAAATAPSGADAAPVSDVLPNSVAVLPFANMSPNPDDAYFAQGIRGGRRSRRSAPRSWANFSTRHRRSGSMPGLATRPRSSSRAAAGPSSILTPARRI